MKRALRIGALVLVGGLVVMQLVPYGRNHHNPPTTQEAPWPSAAARSIAVKACYDCHSNRTNWRWYTFVAPASWYVYHDVQEGRDRLNFTEWDKAQRTNDLVEAVQEGSMPPSQYTVIHPNAKLSAKEKATLVAALRQLESQGGGGGD